MDNYVREKETEIDNVLPPVSDLAAGKPTMLHYVDLDGVEQTIDYADLTDADPYPIPMPIDRECYGTIDTSAQHWATGYGDWLNVKSAIERYCRVSNPARLFDFGCATGRFLRHVMLFSEMESHGCDFAPANIAWVQRHLPEQVQVIENSAEPSLPFPDDHFEVVTAFSVFTHINEAEEDWLKELRRITHPQGILYLTIQNQATWNKVPFRPGSFDHLSKANIVEGNLKVNRELFENPMPDARIVFRMSNASIYNCNVWHTDEYVNSNWARYFDILHIANNGHTGFQSSVIMRSK